MKKFNAPEINIRDLAAVEAVMSSNLVEPNTKIVYSIKDTNRGEADRQKYWAGK